MEKVKLSVLLYTKESCGLCDEVKQELAALQVNYPHQLFEIDITGDTAVFEAYKQIIPVVEIERVEGIRLQAPITRLDLEAALQQAENVSG